MPKSKPLRLVIDTNIWISFLITKRYTPLDSFISSGNIRILFSHELLEELNKTVTPPKFNKYFPVGALEEMLLTFEAYIEIIHVQSKVRACRDNKDNFLLSLAKDGHADLLITGDEDLLEISKFARTEIIKFSSLKNHI